MVTRDFSGRDIVEVLRKHGFEIANRDGSHVRLGYDAPELDDVRPSRRGHLHRWTTEAELAAETRDLGATLRNGSSL